jgi:hypothetical protein
LRPITVTSPPLLVGEFHDRRCVAIGPSNENCELIVPITDPSVIVIDKDWPFPALL